MISSSPIADTFISCSVFTNSSKVGSLSSSALTCCCGNLVRCIQGRFIWLTADLQEMLSASFRCDGFDSRVVVISQIDTPTHGAIDTVFRSRGSRKHSPARCKSSPQLLSFASSQNLAHFSSLSCASHSRWQSLPFASHFGAARNSRPLAFYSAGLPCGTHADTAYHSSLILSQPLLPSTSLPSSTCLSLVYQRVLPAVYQSLCLVSASSGSVPSQWVRKFFVHSGGILEMFVPPQRHKGNPLTSVVSSSKRARAQSPPTLAISSQSGHNDILHAPFHKLPAEPGGRSLRGKPTHKTVQSLIWTQMRVRITHVVSASLQLRQPRSKCSCLGPCALPPLCVGM